MNVDRFLKTKLTDGDYAKLMALNNPRVCSFVADAIQLCKPAEVVVADDSADSLRLSRLRAVETREETPLAISGHTCHYDGINDQGRDREVTRYLVPEGETLPSALNQAPREQGLAEIRKLLDGSMTDRAMIVRFLTLGPANSEFSIPCVECTDSWYVSHSLDLLYRHGYQELKRLGNGASFFATLHSSGKLSPDMVSAESEKKRIYIDYTTDTVYSVNTQYAGNTVGLKKLALRLTIRKADREGWLVEHMFLMGVKGPGGRKTYFAGAFPSACGKTSTAMLPGETILGDDIAYFRAVGGECRAVNAESGIFGIMQNVNEKDDPSIWQALSNPGEVIFSNILIRDRNPYWLGMGSDLPDSGVNFSGKWFKGKKDEAGREIPAAHKNARYTVALKALANCDSELNNPRGIPLKGIMYGGRDAKAYVPAQQSFDWAHGVVAYGAALETETTFAIIGQEGVSEINMMSIQDFVAIPLGKYIDNDLRFAERLKDPPLIFGVNYFLRDSKGKFLNGVRDKHVWVKWMELRVHGEAGAIRGPTGLLPRFEDLVPLFRQLLGKDYTKDDYLAQFTIRVRENLAKIERVETFYGNESNVPQSVFEILAMQRKRLLAVQKEFGDYVDPDKLPPESAP